MAADQDRLDTTDWTASQAGPWLEPSAVSGTSCCQQHVSGSRRLQRGGTTRPVQQPPVQPSGACGPAASLASQPWCGPAGTMATASPGTKGIPGEAVVGTHHHVPHLMSCHQASSPLCPQLSPHPAPRCLPWTAAGPSGWVSSPQTPPRSTPGPHCAGSSPHLSPCQEETKYKGLLFHTVLQQRAPCSTSPLHPSFVPPCPQGCSSQMRCPRPVAEVDLGPAAVLTPTSTAGSSGAHPSRDPPREATRKSVGFLLQVLNRATA